MTKRLWKPERAVRSVYDMDFRAEYESGVRGLILDIDNTLVSQDGPLTERAAAFLKDRIAEGFRVCLLSNNKEERVKSFVKDTGAVFVHSAGKPSRKGYRKAMEMMGTDVSNTVFIGDQLLTDIVGANRAGVRAVLSEPLDPSSDTWLIRWKRKIESIFFGRKTEKKGARRDEKNT